jgi:hypothetical protein
VHRVRGAEGTHRLAPCPREHRFQQALRLLGRTGGTHQRLPGQRCHLPRAIPGALPGFFRHAPRGQRLGLPVEIPQRLGALLLRLRLTGRVLGLLRGGQRLLRGRQHLRGRAGVALLRRFLQQGLDRGRGRRGQGLSPSRRPRGPASAGEEARGQ